MGSSATATLRYGVILGGYEQEWKLQEFSDYELTGTAAWITEAQEDEDGWQEVAERRLRESVGFTETDWHSDGYYERLRVAEARIPVEFEYYGTHDYSDYGLVVKAVDLSSNWGAEAIVLPTADPAWNDQLAAAARVLGITPTETPGWILGAFYG